MTDSAQYYRSLTRCGLTQLLQHTRGVALGDSWISPTDFLAAWGPYLNALSLLDGQPLSNTATIAANAQVCVGRNAGRMSRSLSHLTGHQM